MFSIPSTSSVNKEEEAGNHPHTTPSPNILKAISTATTIMASSTPRPTPLFHRAANRLTTKPVARTVRTIPQLMYD